MSSNVDVEKIGLLRFCVQNMSLLSKISTPEFIIRGIPWSIEISIENFQEDHKQPSLWAYLTCAKRIRASNRSFSATASFKLVHQANKRIKIEKFLPPSIFEVNNPCWGTELIECQELFKRNSGFIENDSINMEVEIDARVLDQMQIEWQTYNERLNDDSEIKIEMKLNKVSDLMIARSPTFSLNGFSFVIDVAKGKHFPNEYANVAGDYLGIYLRCIHRDDSNWSCKTKSVFKLISFKSNVKTNIRMDEDYDEFDCNNSCWGFSDFMSWHDLFDKRNCYVKNDTISLELEIHTKNQIDENPMEKMEMEIETNAIENSPPKIEIGINCIICSENMMDKETSSTPCGHVFCTFCIEKHVKNEKYCPHCNMSIDLKRIYSFKIPK